MSISVSRAVLVRDDDVRAPDVRAPDVGPRMCGALGAAPVDAASPSSSIVIVTFMRLSSWVVVSWAGPAAWPPCAQSISWAMSGRLPIALAASRPAAACCGEPVSRSAARACAGVERRAAGGAQHALHAGQRAGDHRRGARGAGERVGVPGVLVVAGSRLVGAARRARRWWRRRGPSPGRRSRCPSWRSAGASGRGRGGRRAARRRRPGSSPSRARRGGTGSGGGGGSRGRGRRRSASSRCSAPLPAASTTITPRPTRVLDRGQVVGPVAHRQVAVLARRRRRSRARPGALHLEQQDVAGAQLVGRVARSRGRCPSGPRAGRRPRARRRPGRCRRRRASSWTPSSIPSTLVPWLRRSTSPSGRPPASALRRAEVLVGEAPVALDVDQPHAGAGAAGPLPGGAGADARPARRPR